jgi:hypothetical protein
MRWERYEIWTLEGEKWQFTAAFREFDVASEVTRARSARVRLIHAIYDGDKRVEEHILAELGATRPAP